MFTPSLFEPELWLHSVAGRGLEHWGGPSMGLQ
jgi:hypothetical protein